jgi:dolichyl-phosphate-mannose-protein mannosyltransferase
MLVGLAGALSGYDGSFEFKSGEAYPANVPYVGMRVLLACFGVAMVPLAWYTSVELGMSWRACHFMTIMVLCGALSLPSLAPTSANPWIVDVAWLCISRFILLDSMLLFFTCLTVFCLTKFHNQRHQ